MANEKKMDCVILGLLSHESMTGYEIKKRMDITLKYFWGASYGSIYPTLNQLEKDSLVTKVETRENGREKIIYTITKSGLVFLEKWLKDSSVKDELRYETLLKLFFGSQIGPDFTSGHIDRFEEKIKGELPVLKMMVAQLEQIKGMEEAHLYYLLTAKFGVKVYEAYVEWCEETKQTLSDIKKLTN